MEISPTTQPNTSPAQSPAATAPRANALSSDFETFIKMLTTQMQNQDPLNPIESADFAVQLATFSSVEQQVKTNDLITSLSDRIAGLGVAQLSGWIGMDARAQMPVQFDGAPVTINVKAAELADTAELVVQDMNGKEVQRQIVAAQSGAVEWAGVGANGAPLPPGSYKISLASYSDGEFIGSNQAEAHDRIVEARTENGQTILVMSSGHEMPSSDILGLREPGT